MGSLKRDDLKGKRGMYRVVGVDTFDGTDWIALDTVDKEEAIETAENNSGTMVKMYVYDENGNCLADFGVF